MHVTTTRRTAALAVLLALLLPSTPATAASYQVINGRPAAEGAYPAMAALIDVGFGQFCGGTLVDARWVVTAAHCFYDARTGGSSVPPSAIEVALDTTDWRQGGERLGIDMIVLHPDYDELRTVNDIALLRLVTPATTVPAPLGDVAALYDAGRPALVTGWGATDPFGQEPSPVLLEVDVPLVGDADCAAHYDLVPDRHLCAGDPGTEEQPGNDTCQGDSGGPLWTDRDDGVLALIGITSFGNLCGVEAPGVYTEVRTYLDWIGGIIDGSIDPGTPVDPTTPDIPDDAAAVPVRITADGSGTSDPVAQAVAFSEAAFPDGAAGYGVIATSAVFADALGGSALAYGVAPMLFTGPDGTLDEATATELRRVVRAGSPVYVLGGVAAVPAAVDEELRQLGFSPVRLAGAAREETAAIIAAEVVERLQELPLGTVAVATRGNWPDAVAVGQIGAWWGVPVLLTGPDGLHPATADALATLDPATVLVIGGTTVVSEAVVEDLEAVTGPGSTTRLAGATRFGTAASITDYDLHLFGGQPPAYVVAVNLEHEPDGYAHVLAASMLTGAFGGVFAAVGGPGGDAVPPDVSDSICGLDVPVIVAGDTDLISDGAAQALQDASAGRGCQAGATVQLGELTTASLTEALPVRSYTFAGAAGQAVRIRADALPGEPLDPLVELYGPDGGLLGVNDDSPEGGFDALLEVTLAADGIHRVEVSGFGGSLGGFVLSVDPAPLVSASGELTPEHPEVVVTADVPAGTRFVVEMRAVPGTQTDPVLVALDETGEPIASDDDGGGFPNARMVVEAPGGPVQIIGHGYDGSYGPFTIAVAELSGPGDPSRYAVG